MFYYVSLEQNNTSTLGASNAQQEHVNREKNMKNTEDIN